MSTYCVPGAPRAPGDHSASWAGVALVTQGQLEIIRCSQCGRHSERAAPPVPHKLQRYIDGALSNNLPFADCPSTITVSPFHGTVDICPQSTSANLHELNAFNASFQISTENFFLGFICLVPPNPEVGPAL
ncbi:Patatin-like phospholipase domain-containing protein 5 [Saguinus oedipus]|uniref:Patatin-like phospholipase domain-containing protein 5 n=1 Tax=Saguinus oedipus TaxID=9490 RepID=A0ABQ9WH58_SAGOE|nr:Patatin-like phospholipase domain-containing protein 5 [Saguinus oedipus]